MPLVKRDIVGYTISMIVTFYFESSKNNQDEQNRASFRGNRAGMELNPWEILQFLANGP